MRNSANISLDSRRPVGDERRQEEGDLGDGPEWQPWRRRVPVLRPALRTELPDVSSPVVQQPKQDKIHAFFAKENRKERERIL